MAQTFQTIKEATDVDLGEIVRASSLEAKTNRNVNITGLDLHSQVPVQTPDDSNVADNAVTE